MKAHGVQVVLKPGGFVVLRDHTTAGGEGGPDPGFHLESELPSLASEQPGRHHHAGIGRVGARGDGCDDDIAVIQIKHFPVHFYDGALREIVLGQPVAVVPKFVGQALNEM